MKEKFKTIREILNIILFIIAFLEIISLAVMLVIYLANGYIEDNKNIIAFIWAIAGINAIFGLIKSVQLEVKKEEESNTDKILKEIKEELKIINSKK